MFANHCASGRITSRDCMSAGAGIVNADVDLKTQLIYMQMTIKDIGVNMGGLEKKIDAANHGLNGVEQAFLQLKQHQMASRGSNHVELNKLLEQNILMTQKALVMQEDTNTLAKRDSGGASQFSMLQESIEQGVNDLLAKGINTGGPFPGSFAGLTEGKAGAPVVNNILQSQIREELGLLEMSLTKQFNMLQESLNSHRQDSAMLGRALLQAPSHHQQQAIHPQNNRARGDVALVDADARHDISPRGPVATNGVASSPQEPATNGVATSSQAPQQRKESSSNGRRISHQKHGQDLALPWAIF